MDREGGAAARAEAEGGRLAVTVDAFCPMRSFLALPSPFFSAGASVSREEGVTALLLTKRRSRGSYVMEESWLRETMRVPLLPSISVREARTGAVVAARPPLSASRGGDFTVSHF